MAIFHAEFFSKCLMRLVDVDICLPIEDLVEPQPQEGPFPTLYLLHGYTGRSEDWLHGSCIAELSRQYGIAVVMPSGENSFYEDDTEAGFLYSTFVGQELVELTRAVFPLCRDREHTWMAGLSMGGFGTLLNACKFSETFSAAACFSSVQQARYSRGNVPVCLAFWAQYSGSRGPPAKASRSPNTRR